MMATPTVAVLPFRVLGDGDRPATLAAALTVETRAELARAPRGFPLAITAWPAVSQASSMPAPGDVPGDVRYVVRGTTWMEAGVRRVNVQLIERATSREIWSESFSETSGDAHAINLVATRIGRLLGLQIRAAEAMRPLPSHPEAGHYALLGRALFESERGIKETAEALDLFKKALQLDPRSIAALQGIAKSKLIQVQNSMLPVAERADALEQANAAIEEIIRIDRRNVAGHYLRGSLLRARGEPDLAIAAFEQALSLNPNYASAHAEIGRVKIDLGRSEEAIAHLRHAIRLSPTDPVIYAWYFWAGMAAVHLDDRTAALHWLLKARQANRNFAHTLQLMAVTYQRAGDHQRAEAAIREFLATLPGFTLEAWRRGMATRDPVAAGQRQAIEDDLRRLGVPEHRHAVARR